MSRHDKYNVKVYDAITIRFKKGAGDKIRAMALKEGKSLNQYIVDAITEQMKKKGV